MKWKVLHDLKSKRVTEISSKTSLLPGCVDFQHEKVHACIVNAENIERALAKAKSLHAGIA